ncbi:MAG: flavodoxin [Clostridia bacterium]|nr:flavodoxin [Clostridia bacterium]
MKYQIRYYTRSGNTEKLARAIADAVGDSAKSIDCPLEEKTDILFLGCSYYAFDMDEAVKKFIAENKQNIGKIVCFGTSAMMRSMKRPMSKVAEEYGVSLAEEEFHCRGAFGPMHKGRPNDKDLEKVADFAKKIINMSGSV